MTHGDYREMLVAVAGAAGALTGLLFVALSVAPRRDPAQGPHIIRQVRAGAALLAFTNAVAVSLFGLVPDTNHCGPAARSARPDHAAGADLRDRAGRRDFKYRGARVE